MLYRPEAFEPLTEAHWDERRVRAAIAPGMLLAARAMLDWTGEERWRDACRASAEALWARGGADGLWTQCLYGETSRWLGRRTAGDLGVALFAADCLEGRSEYPVLESRD
jgi:hypothetical protein